MSNRIDRYLQQVTPERPPVLREMERYARKTGFPIVGPLVGRLLYQLTLGIGARRILELGSGFGYSAFWFAWAAGAKGRLTLTDLDEANKRLALDFFERAALQSRFEFIVDDALRVAARRKGPFDIVFNDVDKDDYPETIDLAASRLRKGGLFITDNLLWSGKVCERRQDHTTRRIVEFTNQLYRDKRFFTTLLPLRDGLAVALRV